MRCHRNDILGGTQWRKLLLTTLLTQFDGMEFFHGFWQLASRGDGILQMMYPGLRYFRIIRGVFLFRILIFVCSAQLDQESFRFLLMSFEIGVFKVVALFAVD